MPPSPPPPPTPPTSPTDGRPAPSAATAVVGVVGDPVAHSLSPLLHNTAFAALGLDWVSVGFPVPAVSGESALVGAHALGLRGLSVTMPHKETAARVARHRSATAERLGAVNCLVAGDDGWTGENTDGDGLVLALRHGPGFDPAGARCVVVGAGGAARSVVLALALAGAAEVVVVNRSRERAEVAAALAGPVGRVGEPADAGTAALVVHATPVGMAGSGGAGAGGDPAPWPLDPALLGPGQVAVDLVYHPRTTPWLAAVAGRGATVANGLGMLVHQAALQVERWTGRDAPVAAMWAAVAGSDASSGG